MYNKFNDTIIHSCKDTSARLKVHQDERASVWMYGGSQIIKIGETGKKIKSEFGSWNLQIFSNADDQMRFL